jgi:hypothetical protein
MGMSEIEVLVGSQGVLLPPQMSFRRWHWGIMAPFNLLQSALLALRDSIVTLRRYWQKGTKADFVGQIG